MPLVGVSIANAVNGMLRCHREGGIAHEHAHRRGLRQVVAGSRAAHSGPMGRQIAAASPSACRPSVFTEFSTTVSDSDRVIGSDLTIYRTNKPGWYRKRHRSRRVWGGGTCRRCQGTGSSRRGPPLPGRRWRKTDGAVAKVCRRTLSGGVATRTVERRAFGVQQGRVDDY